MSVLNSVVGVKQRSKKRLGRGFGSGKGGYAGRGLKGQNSRRGGGVPLWFEGGQLPMVRKFPHLRGKQRMKCVRLTAEIRLTDLNNLKSEIITFETLKLERLIDSRFKKAKIINTGELKKKVVLQGLRVTAGAKKVIEGLGGKVE
jgi:large subunit ribosomal protein L15